MQDILKVKHTHTECQTVVSGLKELIKRIDLIEDNSTRHHTCEAAIDLCNKLLREPEK
jgi:hypothetical protein